VSVNEHFAFPLTIQESEPAGTLMSKVTTLGPLVDPIERFPADTPSDSEEHANANVAWLDPAPLATVKVFEPPFGLIIPDHVDVCVVAGGTTGWVVVVVAGGGVVVVVGASVVVVVVAAVVVVVAGNVVDGTGATVVLVVVETVPPLPTGSVGAEVTFVVPSAFVTLTMTWSEYPVSLDCTVYLAAVATVVHALLASQRRHCTDERLNGAEPVHAPCPRTST